MEHLSSHEVITKIVNSLIIIWGSLFIPSIFMVILVTTGHGDVASHTELTWKLLYYNLLFFPFLILVSCISSWVLLKRKHYTSSIVLAMLPFIAVFVETVVLDLVLLFL